MTGLRPSLQGAAGPVRLATVCPSGRIAMQHVYQFISMIVFQVVPSQG